MDTKTRTSGETTRQVGLITLPIGVALAAAPTRVARLLRFGDQSKALRVIGIADLALVPGLLSGRHQREWMVARGSLNVAIALYCVRVARQNQAPGAKVGALAMVIATIEDGRRIVGLRRTRAPNGQLDALPPLIDCCAADTTSGS